MNKQIEALKMAMGFASVISEAYATGGQAEKVIKACKEALAEAEKQEIGEAEIRQMLKEIEWCHQELEKKEWQSLSDDEIQNELKNMWDKGLIPSYSIVEFARAIEQALKEKND